MSDPEPEETPAAARSRSGNRVVGPFDAFHIMTEGDARKADEALERLLAQDDTETEMVSELHSAKPLAHPVAFAAAHRTFIRSLEVYDRNSRRRPTDLPAGPLRPIITPLVGLIAGMIARIHQRRVLREVRLLYVMREANSPLRSREHRVLASARRQVDALSPDLSGRGFAVPAFLLGGAVLSAAASFVSDVLHNGAGRLIILGVVLLLTIGAFWCILIAAAVTRRRTRLVLDQPIGALWQTIGGAGDPPHDPSRIFVAVATVLLLIGWVITPAIVATLSHFF